MSTHALHEHTCTCTYKAVKTALLGECLEMTASLTTLIWYLADRKKQVRFWTILGSLKCLFLVVPSWGVDYRKDSVPDAAGTRILPLLNIASLLSLGQLENCWEYYQSFRSWETPYVQTQHRCERREQSKKSSLSNSSGRQKVLLSWC